MAVQVSNWSGGESQALAELVKAEAPNIHQDSDLCRAAERIGRAMLDAFSSQNRMMIAGFMANPRARILVARGVPLFPQLGYLSTPTLSDTPLQQVADPALIQTGLLEAMGMKPVSYREENSARVMRHVVPKVGSADEMSSQGGQQRFSWHVDNPHLKIPGVEAFEGTSSPSLLCLAGIRNHTAVPTRFLDVDEIVKRLSAAAVAELMKPQFLTSAPDSFQGATGDGVPRPVLFRKGRQWQIRYDPNMTGINRLASQALKGLVKALGRCTSIDIIVTPGSLVVFKQHQVLHSRDPFIPDYFNGNDRWLLRVYGLNEEFSNPVHPDAWFVQH